MGLFDFADEAELRARPAACLRQTRVAVNVALRALLVRRPVEIHGGAVYGSQTNKVL
jgi:hypothetical protein